MRRQTISSVFIKFVASLGFSMALVAGSLQADSLVVQPAQLNLSATKPVSDLLLRNDATEERTIHVEINSWNQASGIDQLVPSGKLIVHPETVRLRPGETARVRVGLKLSGPLWEEQAFQVILKEVSRIPDVGSASSSSESRVVGRSGVPVFLLPPGKVNPRMSWLVSRSPNGSVTLKASNSGGAHIQLHSAILSGPNGQRIDMHNLSAVILPGGSRSWSLMDGAVGGLWQLTAETNAGPIQAELELDPNLASSASLSLAD
ncbi:MAG TPA: fimbria/pilus periplasmic chaperone [Xanthomonadales bacterium]|nr:fimbria/pilus periplasmic chaperone [Xanthomonadales bacterium]